MIIEVYKAILTKILEVKTYIQSLNFYTENLIVKIIVRIQVFKVIKEINNIYIRITK